jgi:hypothetical protein
MRYSRRLFKDLVVLDSTTERSVFSGRPSHSHTRLVAIGEFNAGHFERAYDGSHVCAIWYMPAAFEILDRRPINASAGGEHRLAPIEKT